MPKLTVDKLAFWVSKGYNVLLESRHGVGKTSIIREVMEKSGRSYAYYSAATMDPFVDFVGVPMKIDGPKGSYIELIRPKRFVQGDIEWLVFDELNRAPSKVNNAVMELVQFGRVNGEPISKNFKGIIAAINPDDDESGYAVTKLDPAQKDRFDVWFKLDYDCDDAYFYDKYKEQGRAAVQYWRSLPDAAKLVVSPRRLDKAVQMYNDKCDLRDVLPQESNPSRFSMILGNGPVDAKLRSLCEGDPDEARRWFVNSNNYDFAIKELLGNNAYRDKLLPLLPPEKIAVLYTDDRKVQSYIEQDLKDHLRESPFASPLMEMAQANQNEKLAKQVRDRLGALGITAVPTEVARLYNRPLANDELLKGNEITLDEMIKEVSSKSRIQTYNRIKLYDEVKRHTPQNMTAKAAVKVLEICSICAECTPEKISEELPDLAKISSHAIVRLLESGISPTELANDIRSKWPRLAKARTHLGAPSVLEVSAFLAKEADRRKAREKTARVGQQAVV